MNSQTIEPTPVYMVNHADHFTKAYRNVILIAESTVKNRLQKIKQELKKMNENEE